MKAINYGLLLITSMLWAGNFVASKVAVGYVGPETVAFLRYFIAIIILIPVVLIQENKFLPPKQSIWPLIGMGFTGVFLFNMLVLMALEHTSATNTGVISALNPIAIALLAFIFVKEKLSLRQILGMGIGLVGVLIVITNGDWLRMLELNFNIGDLYMLLAVLTWGVYSLIIKNAAGDLSPLFITFWSGIFGLFMFVPFTFKKIYFIQSPDLNFWSSIGYTSIGATVLAMLFWNIGVRNVGGTQSGMFLNFNPIFTALLAFLLLGETLSWPQIWGTIVVINGVIIYSSKYPTYKITNILTRFRLGKG
ncbi:DMT family transporter [Chengkuizengella axinellae]|uniref:DMT family transporter n=1 Tax=Chengkuizengella axinellae TaxID=3064388 RepID=A0ABT9J4G8_9BACL|nr:DMT family transporter [Chengkuizengella sp. 2205SS18-9]MDP5276373.1 DMT family transporter [Chengkuizengella sp. 2205SS18-9]